MRAHLRGIIRRIVIQGLWWCGITRLLRRRLSAANGIVVLMLHRVLSDSAKQESNSEATMVVGDRVYARMVEYIRQHYRLVDASAEKVAFEGDRLGIVLTFDDGWVDNHDPLLRDRRENAVPALVFISPSLVGKRDPFWPERVRAILSDASEAELRVAVESLKPLSPEIRARRIEELAEKKGKMDASTVTVDQTMTWAQLEELRAAGIAFGSHTLDHEILTSLKSVNELDWQLGESKRQIASRWGKCDLLAYPNGNHNDEVVQRAARLGYGRAFTVTPGVWTQGTDPLRIPRMNITDQRVAFDGEFSAAAFEFSVVVRAYRHWRAERSRLPNPAANSVNVRAQAGD